VIAGISRKHWDNRNGVLEFRSTERRDGDRDAREMKGIGFNIIAINVHSRQETTL
jgi:hypothetical protein